ncbi:MAG: hypothetical protein V4592_09795 [Bacteroidota bacterium]
MKKFKVLALTIFLTPILAGLYGILHDQFTYTISHEYFTKFKFLQFGLVNHGKLVLPSARLAVAVVGFLATWWTGIFVGIGHALVGLIHQDAKAMGRAISKAILITIAITAITGLIGLAYGGFYLANTGVNWLLPDNLIDKKHFIMVGSMHNFSYMGGAIGLISGIIYQIVIAGKIKKIFPAISSINHR